MFKFDLQPVLDFRLSLEEKSLVAYSEQQRCVESELRVLEGLKSRKTVLMEEFAAKQDKGMSASDIAMYISYIRQMITRVQNQQAVVKKEEALLEERRLALVESVRNRKVMENLKEKKIREHKAEILEKERKEMDEYGIVKFQSGVEDEETDHTL